MDEKALKFPARVPSERPELKEIKEAVGFDQPMAFPEEMEEEPSVARLRKEELPMPPLEEETPGFSTELKSSSGEKLFVKMDVYRRIIGEMDLLKKNLLQLQEINKNLDSSEFNEDKHFNKLRRLMKGLHDNLLSVDKALFKS